MKKKKYRRKRGQPPDAHVSRVIEATATAFDMAEQGLRPMPLEIEDPLKEQTFTGDTWETCWHFADQLLLLSISADMGEIQVKFDILVDEYEFATTLVDIPILAHLELEVTCIDTLPSSDTRYNDIPEGIQLWRVHSADFREHPRDTLQMLFLSEEVDTDNGEQHDKEE